MQLGQSAFVFQSAYVPAFHCNPSLCQLTVLSYQHEQISGVSISTYLPTKAGLAASQQISTTQLRKPATRQPFTQIYCPEKGLFSLP